MLSRRVILWMERRNARGPAIFEILVIAALTLIIIQCLPTIATDFIDRVFGEPR